MNKNNVNISAIDRALAAAKARKAVKDSIDPAAMPRKAEKSEDKPDAAAKAAAKAEKEAQKAAKKAERDAAREARKAAKADKDNKKPAHMKKVERALSKLPSLNESTQLIFNEATCNLSAQQLDALAHHILHHNRTMATINAMKTEPLRIGDTVRITGGDPKFVGMVGTIVKSRQLRAKIQVPGMEKLVYIFTGQAETVSQPAAAVG
jgi:hypothetical protein